MKSNTANHVYTEDFDYTQTGNTSIWGDGDADTISVLKKLAEADEFKGEWLHFAAGDGRYNNFLLSQVEKVIATDIDVAALEKLRRLTPQELIPKLVTQAQNLVEPFPFGDNTFDGVFNTGTLHLFPKDIVRGVIEEVQRVLKSNGLFIFDFATDVQRIKADGTRVGRSVVEYSQEEAEVILTKMLQEVGYEFRLHQGTVLPEKVTAAEGTYMFSCNYWLAVGRKK